MTNIPFDGLDVKQFVLEKARIGMRIPVNSFLLQSMEINRIENYDMLFGDMLYSLEAFVLKDTLPPVEVEETLHYTVSQPATWWDHFKADQLKKKSWFWGWVKWCKPPLYLAEGKEATLKVSLERWITYPEAQEIPQTFGDRYHGCTVSSKWL